VKRHGDVLAWVKSPGRKIHVLRGLFVRVDELHWYNGLAPPPEPTFVTEIEGDVFNRNWCAAYIDDPDLRILNPHADVTLLSPSFEIEPLASTYAAHRQSPVRAIAEDELHLQSSTVETVKQILRKQAATGECRTAD
jgi:hypothetical protein